MSQAAVELAPVLTVNPAEFAKLDSLAAQEAWLIKAAAAYSDDLLTALDVAQLTPADSPESKALFDQAAAEGPSSMYAFWVLADLSLRGGRQAEKAWNLAHNAAMTLDTVGFCTEPPLALEVLATGQTDPKRLDAIGRELALKSSYVKQRVWCAIAKQHAANGDAQAAMAARERIPHGQQNRHWNEAQLAIIAYRARTDAGPYGADLHIQGLAEHMKPWGELKLQRHRHHPPDEVWPIIDAGLEEHWTRYSVRQHLEIVQDLIDMGQLDRAHMLALKIATPDQGYWPMVDRQKMLVRIAHRMADTDPEAGLAVLNQLTTEAEQTINVLLNQALELPEDSRTMSRNQLDQWQARGSLNQAAMHRIAIAVRRDAYTALHDLRIAGFYGDKPDDDGVLVYRTMAQRVVARALANAGYTQEAVAVTAVMPDAYSVRSEKCRAFVEIARAVHRQIIAGIAGRTTLLAGGPAGAH